MSFENIDGHAGLNSEHIADDSFIICGIDTNISGSAIRDDYGRSITSFDQTDTLGPIKTPWAFPEIRAVDNGGDHEGGNYTIAALNRLNFEAACGGINMNSTGNVNLFSGGGILNLISESLVEIHGEIIKCDANGLVRFSGPNLAIETEAFSCKNLTNFESNVFIHGGAAVKGELYVSHITAPKDMYATEISDPLSVKYAPGHIIEATGMIKMSSPSPDGNIKDGSVCIVKLAIDAGCIEREMGRTSPHLHPFYHIAVDLKGDIQEVMADSNAINNSKAGAPKAPTGLSNLAKNIGEGMISAATRAAGEYI